MQVLPLTNAYLTRPDKKSLFFSNSDSLLRVALKLELPSLVISVLEKSSGGLGPDLFREFGRAMALRDLNLWLPVYASARFRSLMLTNGF